MFYIIHSIQFRQIIIRQNIVFFFFFNQHEAEFDNDIQNGGMAAKINKIKIEYNPERCIWIIVICLSMIKLLFTWLSTIHRDNWKVNIYLDKFRHCLSRCACACSSWERVQGIYGILTPPVTRGVETLWLLSIKKNFYISVALTENVLLSSNYFSHNTPLRVLIIIM